MEGMPCKILVFSEYKSALDGIQGWCKDNRHVWKRMDGDVVKAMGERARASASGSSQKKYINLASGTKSNKNLLAILREVTAMQRHYATLSIRERMECARITGMM